MRTKLVDDSVSGLNKPDDSSFRRILVVCALLFLTQAWTLDLRAQITSTWIAGSGDWSTAANWNNGLPGSADTAIIGNSGTADLAGAGTAKFLKVGESDTGSLVVSGGTLAVGSDSYVGSTSGTGTATVSSGTWTTGSSLIVGFNSGAGTLTIGGGTVSASTVYVAFSGASSGTLNLNGGYLVAGQVAENTGGGTGVGAVNFNGGGVRAMGNSAIFFSGFETGDIQFGAGGAFVDTQGFTITIANILQGSGGLTKEGAGTLNLVGSSSYTGGTTVSSGTLALTAGSGRLADTGALTVNGGTFSIGSISDTVGAVTLNSGTVSGTSGSLSGSSYSVQSGTISAVLAGSGTLTKTTAGSVTLSGNNTYSGATTVSGGTLQINGSTAAGSAVTVNNGATLGGNGTIGGSVTLNTGAILAPGSGLGTLRIGNLTWHGSTDGAATMKFTLGSSDNTSSLLNITGTFAKGGGNNFIFDFQGTGNANNPTTYTLATFSTSTGFSAGDFGYINLGDGLSGNFLLNSGNLQLVAVPEPAAWGVITGGLAMVTVFWRRRWSRLRGV